MSTPPAPQQPSGPSGELKVVESIKASNRVYCRWEVTDDSLKDLFCKFGKVNEARVVRGPRMRAFGFVTFESEVEASKAISALNGKGMVVTPMTVEYAAPERPRARAPRAPTAQAPAPVPATTAPQQPRRQRAQQAPARGQPQGQQGALQPSVEGAPARARARRRRPRRVAETKDPNWGKVVLLIPDPIRCPIPQEAKITELMAGPRNYRPGIGNGKLISSLILNADPTKGPFNCDFRLGEFDLKLLSVKVSCKPDGDCRVGARIMHVTANRSREVFLRIRPNPADNRHKFFELTKPGTDETAPQSEVFFVGLDSIQLDMATGLWKKIVLSLVSAIVPRRPPRVLAAASSSSAPAPAPGPQ